MTRYFAVGEQTQLGTPTTPSHYIRVTEFNIAVDNQSIYPELADTRYDVSPVLGAFKVTGSITLPIELENIGYLFKFLFGSVTTSTIDGTTGVYEHIFAPVDFGGSIPVFTASAGKDDVTEETIVGACLNTMTLSAVVKELLIASFEFGGVSAQLESLASPSFPSPDWIPYWKGVIEVDGSNDINIESFRINYSNNINFDDAYRITRNNGRLPKEFAIGGVKVTIEFDARYKDTTYFQKVLGGTSPQESQNSASIKLDFIGKSVNLSSGTTHKRLTVYLPKVYFDTISSPVRSRDRLVVSVTATCVNGTASVSKYSGTTDINAPIVIYLRNKTSSY